MATSSEERNGKRNKYVVNFVPSSSPNRRLLVFILAAVALVTLVGLLATFIPIYMTGSGDDKSNEQFSEREVGDDSRTNSSSRSAVTGVSTTQQHHPSEVIIDTTTSIQKESTSIQATNASPSSVVHRATSTVTSVMSSNFEQSSEKQSKADSVRDSSTRSTSKSGVTSNLIHSSTLGSSANISLSPTPAATSSGRGTISSLVKAVLSTRITSPNFIKEPSMISFSKISSGDFMIGTASKTASAVSSLASLVPNTEAKWSRWSPWSDCTKTCGTGARHRTRTCVAQNQDAVFAPITCAGKPRQNKTCAEWNCPDLI